MKALELKVPPVAQFLVFVAVMWLLAKYLPALSFEIPARRTLVVLFFCLGGIVAAPAIAAFRSAGTTVDPRDPGKASLLVVRGIYRYMGFLLTAWAIHLSNPLGFAGLPLFVFCMNRLQIRAEEAAMEAQFGDEYRSYRESVRRWL